MRIGVRVGAIRCFSAPQPRSASLPRRLRCHCSSVPLPAPPAPARAACRSIRLLCGSADRLSTRACSCVVLAVRRCKGGDGRGERGRGGRLFEVTEIATTDNKMLMEEMTNNIAWCSMGIFQTEALEMFQLMYGSTDRCPSAPSPWNI